MRKAVLFGAGIIGKKAFYKLVGEYEIIAFSDNNETRWGERYCGVQIVEPKTLENLDATIIICSDYYAEIYAQLTQMGIKDILGVEPRTKQLMTLRYGRYEHPVQLGKKRVKRILFVQNAPCIRTYKFAYLMKQKGVSVDVAYSEFLWEENEKVFPNLFENRYPINSWPEFVTFLNESAYDIIHCSNEPDILTTLALCSNKKVVHDTHDMMSLCREMSEERSVLEFVANYKCAGRIYTGKVELDHSINRYGITEKNTFLIANLLLEKLKPTRYLPKLSSCDGEIHCVYEGTMNNIPTSYRYFDDIFMRIAESGIHVHFYTQYNPEYCNALANKHEKIHYEGCISPEELAVAMTQYDCGLVVFQVTDEHRKHLETGTPNKLFDYLNSGLPVVTNNHEYYREFLEENPVGVCVSEEEKEVEAIKKAVKITVEEDYLSKHGLTMESQADALLEFYTSLL